MGSVKNLTVTGDNDPEIMPTEYYRHYMYCDLCGSFDLKPWILPGNHSVLTFRLNWIEKFSSYALISSVLTSTVMLIMIIINLILNKSLVFNITVTLWLVISLLSLLLFVIISSKISSKIFTMGVYCRRCDAQYEHGSSFFTDLEANPLHLDMDEVPLPLHNKYWIKGNVVE